MISLYHKVRQIVNGTTAINNQIKYTIICIGIALIHMVFTIAFGIGQILLLFWYNIGATLFYLYHSVVSIRKERYLSLHAACVIEILFHATLATLMLGWDWGFNLYIMALVPVTFYITYTLPNIEGKITYPVVVSIVVSVCFLLNRVICEQVEPLYQGSYPEMIHKVIYYTNVIVAFVMLVLFSILFALEIQYMQRRLEQENRRLDEIANYDPLTHLLNRRSMNAQLKATLEYALREKDTFSLMLLDIDDFKKVNDTYGHDCGDEVLIRMADIISQNVREHDVVCRWGGEEILILLRCNLEIAKQVAERICEEIRSSTVRYKECDIKVTVTIGLSGYRESQSIRDMIEEADHNLYYGKRNGKNQYVCS